MKQIGCMAVLASMYAFLVTVVPSQGAEPAFAQIQDNPALPRVLLIGDSISMGYTLPVRELLAGRANVHRVADNCGPTSKAVQDLDAWRGTSRWDVIHFNGGIWDAHVLEDGTHRVPVEQYRKNLEQLVTRLKSTQARLIWATTTPVKSIT